MFASFIILETELAWVLDIFPRGKSLTVSFFRNPLQSQNLEILTKAFDGPLLLKFNTYGKIRPCGKWLHVYEKYWNWYDIKLQRLWWKWKFWVCFIRIFHTNYNCSFFECQVSKATQVNNAINVRKRTQWNTHQEAHQRTSSRHIRIHIYA